MRRRCWYVWLCEGDNVAATRQKLLLPGGKGLKRVGGGVGPGAGSRLSLVAKRSYNLSEMLLDCPLVYSPAVYAK